MTNKEQTCCFTGHRILPSAGREQMLENLEKAIDELVTRGVTDFISGGALGFDQIAARAVLKKRESDARVRLIFALPCRDQDIKWNESQKAAYRALLMQADEVVYVSEQYDNTCMRRRNDYMIAQSAHCICALTRTFGGTASTVRRAEKAGLAVTNVAAIVEKS